MKIIRSFKVLLIAALICADFLKAQDSLNHVKPPKKWGLGVVPAVAFSTDWGFQYGVAGNLYNFGTTYPDYKYTYYFEWSRTTKGNSINEIFFDQKEFLNKNLRLTYNVGYFFNKQLPFYGFDGYNAQYLRENEDQNNATFASRMYYRLDRAVIRCLIDFQYKTTFKPLRILAGAGFFDAKIKPVDIDEFNESLDDDDKILKNTTLYEKYVSNGIISEDEKDGGKCFLLKSGVIYDTRDNETNANRGIWAEVILISAPKLGNNVSFTQVGAVFRHYFTISSPRLTMANRIGIQTVVAGQKPFYMLPYLFSSYKLRDAFGGEKTIRGVLTQRIQGNGVAYGNFELRYKFLYGRLFKQETYLCTNVFADWGMVTSKYLDNPIPVALENEIKPGQEKPHWTTGAGLRVVMNQNFVVTADYGRALDPQDGKNALYITLGFLY